MPLETESCWRSRSDFTSASQIYSSCLQELTMSYIQSYLPTGTYSTVLQNRIIIPANKGKGRDPLIKKSYRGITLNSVLAKVFEIILLQMINYKPVLEDAGVPQVHQTAYREGVSCQDSIFAGQEANAKFIKEGDNVFSCFYDLASAFDTVEFCVLLEDAGVREVLETHMAIVSQPYESSEIG